MNPFEIRSDRQYANLINSFDQVLPTEKSNEILYCLLRHHLAQVSPLGMYLAGHAVEEYLNRSDFPSLCLYDPDIRDLDAEDQYHISQCIAFFKKRRDIDLGIDKELAALEKFRTAERACKVTNECFLAWGQGRFAFDPVVERVLHTAQRKILYVLGDAPVLDDIRPRFGPGATTQVQRRNACVVEKLRQVPACSTNLAPFAGELLSRMAWGDSQSEYEVEVPIHLSRLDFVPKNAKTYRGIMTQPAMNSMWQLGIGAILERRLKKVGLDTHDQSKNQHWAWVGSKTGLCATLDLSSASDTIARRLVAHLLPTDWFELLDMFRCSEAVYKDEIIYLEQFSSMGNGFTFPLETLIFWAISDSVKEIYDAHSLVPVTVFGDDIIVPNDTAIPLMRVLRVLGFTPNQEKSFWYGSFRESCGSDFVDGINVRPCFIDDTLTGADVFRIHNFYVGRGDFSAAEFLEHLIDPSIRLRGPKGYGDGYLHSHFWVSRPVSAKKGWSGFTFESWAYSATSLRHEIIRTFRGSPSSGGAFRTFNWKSRYEFLVRRLATYLTYQSERERDCPSELALKRTDLDGFRTPGTAGVHRMKIYIFEAPVLRLMDGSNDDSSSGINPFSKKTG